MCALDTDPHGSIHRFSWAGLQCHSDLSHSFSFSMPRSTSQVSRWRQENLHLLTRDRRHQTASTSQGEGRALRYILCKKNAQAEEPTSTLRKAVWGPAEAGRARGSRGARRSAVLAAEPRSGGPAGPAGLGRDGAAAPPGCPCGGDAASQGGTSETSYLAAICILMVPPAVLPDCFTGRKGNRKTLNPLSKVAKRLLRARGVW